MADRRAALASAHLLDPAVVARLGTMELKARTIVEGLLLGLHRSPYHGFSTEFAEYRDLRARRRSGVDRLEGLRAQRPLLRQEVRRRDQPDVPPPARHERVDGLRQRRDDQAGLRRVPGRGDRVARRPASATRSGSRPSTSTSACACRRGRGPATCTRSCSRSNGAKPSAGSDVAKPLRSSPSARARGLIVLISDLLDDPDDVVNGPDVAAARAAWKSSSSTSSTRPS